MESNPAIVPLPHGFLSAGARVTTARLRELNGYDEQYLAEIDQSLPSAVRTTDLLDRMATVEATGQSLGNRELISRLTLGDRVALLLETRRLTFGDKIESIVTCPACRAEMSVTLSVKQLLLPSDPGAEAEDGEEVSVGDLSMRVRPVTGADLEFIASAAGKSDTRLEEELVRSCIISSDRPLPSHISPEIVAKVSAKLEEMDPQAEIVLDLSCPACRHSFKTPFSIEDFFLREVLLRAPQLEREVHWLAFNYHWSEEDILSLPMRKRGKYVELINRTLSGETM